jgi:hypothetical protein
MSNPVNDKSADAAEIEANTADIDHAADLDEKAKPSAYKADAIEAENAEHNMTVLEAVKLYPMASFWAFVMSSTIVSSWISIHPPSPFLFAKLQLTVTVRLWSPTASSSWALLSP